MSNRLIGKVHTDIKKSMSVDVFMLYMSTYQQSKFES